MASREDDESTVQDILSYLLQLQPTVSHRPPESGLRTISFSGAGLRGLGALLGAHTAGPYGGRIFADVDEEDEEDNEEGDEDYFMEQDPDDGPLQQWFPPATEPQKQGVELLQSGDFGRIGHKLRAQRNDLNITKSLLRSANRAVPSIPKEDYTSNLVPNTNGTTVATYDSNMYTAQFSDDSSFYYTCAQDFKLHIFDMTKPPHTFETVSPRSYSFGRLHAGLKTSMPLKKVVQGYPGRWTVTDANLSPDNERMIYSSITPTVYMTSTSPEGSSAQTPISFADTPTRYGFSDGFGIWSCRFSADGNEVVAGGDGMIFVYDLPANRRTVKIAAHNDDVNSCCWADTGSGNVLVSASDDTFIKVWDRRSLGASQKPSGVLIGHTEGITYVSAKGDGRYVISNGKDQALRLWDLRKMRSSQDFEVVQRRHYGISNFDYRYPGYPKPKYKAHPQDCSVMTYRGHSVFRTLIRCHFSPGETTGGQYLYSGSSDGKIHIWSLDGQVVQILDRSNTLPPSFSPSGPEPEMTNGVHLNNCVRDVSWHSQEPVIMSAAWDSGRGGTAIARHEWKGLSKMHGKLQDWVEKKRREATDPLHGRRRSRRLERLARQRSARQHVPGGFEAHDDEQDDEEDEYLGDDD